MANTRPYTDAHAIACVDVALFFDARVANATGNELIEAVDAYLLARDFVRKSTDDKKVVWHLLDVNKARVEEAHLHHGFIHVVAFEYRGWTISSATAIDRLGPILERCQSGELIGQACGLAVVDIFIDDSGATYNSADVFSKASRVLPPVIHSTGPSWKHDVTWVEEADIRVTLAVNSNSLEERVAEDQAHLDEVKFDAAEGGEAVDHTAAPPSSHLTQIDLRLSLNGNLEAPSAVEWSNDEFKKKLDRLHAVNKRIMLDLLSEEMTQAIGLKE